MVSYALSYEKALSDRPFRHRVGPFAFVPAHPKSPGKITHPLLMRCSRRYLFKGPEENGDPAEGRSDHHSFQVVGYPACVATEDFFAGPGPGLPQSEANPNYHKTSDTFVDPEYAADIARAVAAAAWATANS
jgi:hypothetical protein